MHFPIVHQTSSKCQDPLALEIDVQSSGPVLSRYLALRP